MVAKRPPAISILIVDDHRTFAEALALAFRPDDGFAVTVASTGQSAVDTVSERHPDVVLVDVEMPGMDGIQAIRRIKDVDPSAAVLVLSGHEDDLVKGRALEAGASGFLSKITPLEELPETAKRAHRGDPLMDPEEVVRLLRVLRRRRHQESTERQRANRLTPRQTEILQMMADGFTPPEISDRLGVSPYTLRTHVQNTLTRLGVHTKLEAVAMAIRHGKISARR